MSLGYRDKADSHSWADATSSKVSPWPESMEITHFLSPHPAAAQKGGVSHIHDVNELWQQHILSSRGVLFKTSFAKAVPRAAAHTVGTPQTLQPARNPPCLKQSSQGRVYSGILEYYCPSVPFELGMTLIKQRVEDWGVSRWTSAISFHRQQSLDMSGPSRLRHHQLLLHSPARARTASPHLHGQQKASQYRANFQRQENPLEPERPVQMGERNQASPRGTDFHCKVSCVFEALEQEKGAETFHFYRCSYFWLPESTRKDKQHKHNHRHKTVLLNHLLVQRHSTMDQRHQGRWFLIMSEGWKLVWSYLGYQRGEDSFRFARKTRWKIRTCVLRLSM